jgi:ferrous iron transport protein B
VGNWPGVTVEKKEGKLKGNSDVKIIDLPGIYSLSPYTLEEVIAREFLIEARPDVIVNIVDGTNLERNLYLTMQLLELGIPTVVAINMMDILEKSGDTIDVAALATRLGCAVVEISALKNSGIDQLKQTALAAAEQRDVSVAQAAAANEYFSTEVKEALEKIEAQLPAGIPAALKRFYAVKFFERDEKIACLLLEETAQAAEAAEAAEVASATGAASTTGAASATGAAKTTANATKEALDTTETASATEAAATPPDKSAPKTLKDFIDVEPIIKASEASFDDDSESIIINERYAHITTIIEQVHTNNSAGKDSTSDKIDRVVTNRILALPIFAVVMFLVYFIAVTTVGALVTDWANEGVFGDGWFLGVSDPAYTELVSEYEDAQLAIEAFNTAAEENGLDPDSSGFMRAAARADFEAAYDTYDDDTGLLETVPVDYATYSDALKTEEPDPAAYGVWVPGIPVLVEAGLVAINAADWLQALILDGILAGVGAVLGFVPQMLILFLLLALLEQCGYMSRIAFILDRVFRRFGLSGKSFIPILIGTGCGVPGIMASRTIENQNDRRMTIMTTTFIPCSAKLPIIALFAGAIFAGAWWVAPSAYFLGIAAILCSGIILKKTRPFAGDPAPFLMELPAYHRPTAGSVLRSTWERGWSFIKRAGTIILLASVLIWFISSYGFTEEGFGAVEDQGSSILAVIGGAICWIFAPQGFGNWQATSATISGLIAKENLVSTFGILYGVDGSWYNNLQLSYTMLSAYALLAFNLLCAPCVAAMGAIRREMNNRTWFWAALGYQCGLAWIVALWIYQFGGLITGEVELNVFTFVAVALAAGFFWLLFRPQRGKHKNIVSQRAIDA